MIFGMGMLDMGITFSSRQLVLDNAIVTDIRRSLEVKTFPDNISDNSYVHDLIEAYKGNIPQEAAVNSPNFWQEAKKFGGIEEKAADIANEIINTHKVQQLDRSVLNEMRRIVLSVE